MAKKLKVGVLLVNNRTFDNNGRSVQKTMVSLALGSSKNQDPTYNTTVELIVKDHTGKVVHRQENGFLNLVDFRKQPDELLAEGRISESDYEAMKERISRVSESIKYNLEVTQK